MDMKFASPPRMAHVLAVALSLAIGIPASAALAQGPTLAEIARKEQERRKTLMGPAKVYTNKDLPTPAAPPAAAALPPATPPATDAGAGKATAKKDEKDEAWWRARMAQAREEVRRNEMFAEALQTRINSLSADVINRDDPGQRAKLSDDRQKAVAELERVKLEIDNGKKQIGIIEEEARVASVPPGWLR